jgi:endogenous inhibitor of DNA gyrase (YacG/DUF329 family)
MEQDPFFKIRYSEYLKFELPPHEPCSTCQTIAPCQEHDPHNPRFASFKQKVRIVEAWLKEEYTDQVPMLRNFFSL